MQNVLMWMVAGGLLGWAGMALFGYNKERGVLACIIIGALGAVMGGKMIAPMLGASAGQLGAFSMPMMLIALAAAAACLLIGNKVHERYGF